MFAVRPASARYSSVLEALNEEQVAAVTHRGGPLLVLAGAGTGKTTTLSARVAWLVEQGVVPERVLLLTFTRRAAREMLSRVRSMVGAGAAGIVGGTFHSVAYRLIRAHAAALGLPPNAAVLDASDAADLLDLLREELGLAGQKRRFPRKGTLAGIYSATRALDTSHPEGCAVMKHGGPVLSTGLPSARFERMQVGYAVWRRRRGSPRGQVTDRRGRWARAQAGRGRADGWAYPPRSVVVVIAGRRRGGATSACRARPVAVPA